MPHTRARFNEHGVTGDKSSAARVLLAALAGLGTAGCATGAPLPQLAAARERLAADCSSGLFSGIVAVRDRGRNVFFHSCGYADAERKDALSATSRFKLFSTSKPFTAAAILALVELGRMELNAPLRTYLSNIPEEWAPITIRQLLQHRSGVPELTENLLTGYTKGGHRSHSGAMDHLLGSLNEEDRKLAGTPGESWRYSNFGYELLASAAAKVEGQPFHEVLRRRVFIPAGMRTASVELAGAAAELKHRPSPGLVAGFVGAPDNLRRATSYSFVQQGAGALHASYEDLMAFDAALSRGRLLSAETQRRIEAESVPVNETVRYGYGWMIRSAGKCHYWQHSGGNNGYTSEFARSPKAGVTVVILSNLGFAKVDGIRKMLMEAMLVPSEIKGRC